MSRSLGVFVFLFDMIRLDAFGTWCVLGSNGSPSVGAEGRAEEETGNANSILSLCNNILLHRRVREKAPLLVAEQMKNLGFFVVL